MIMKELWKNSIDTKGVENLKSLANLRITNLDLRVEFEL